MTTRRPNLNLGWVVALLLAAPAVSQVRPRPGLGDPRLQSVDYKDDQVVEIVGAPGYQITVALAPDERIQSIAVGDSGAWHVAPNRAGDHMFVKPVQPGINTNMTVVTDARTYAFDLKALDGPASDMAYTISFRYPMESVTSPEPSNSFVRVGRYRVAGARALRPARITDDGEHTYIEWRADAPLPAIYAVDETGHEVLVNGAMRGSAYVIDSVNAHLLFRVDRQLARADRLNPKRLRR